MKRLEALKKEENALLNEEFIKKGKEGFKIEITEEEKRITAVTLKTGKILAFAEDYKDPYKAMDDLIIFLKGSLGETYREMHNRKMEKNKIRLISFSNSN